MNYFQLSGGLGNQMFQYVFAKYIEHKTGTGSVIYFYGKNDAFDKMQCVFEEARESIKCQDLVKENGFYIPRIGEDSTFYLGFWQDQGYYQEIAEMIKCEFDLKDEFITADMRDIAYEMKDNESIAIHVRRNDYIVGDGARLFTQLNSTYYEEALMNILEYCDSDNLKLYIFSDDYQYISENMSTLCGIPATIMPMRKAYEDIYLMKCARHHIIANSTFSWWGAVLSEGQKSGITVAPRNWYKMIKSPNLYLDNWIVV